jgi:hypothetical protein
MSVKDRVSDGTTRIDDLADDAIDQTDSEVQTEAAERIDDGASTLLDRSRSLLSSAGAFLKSAAVTGASAAKSASITAFNAVRDALGVGLAALATFARNHNRKLAILSVAATVFVVAAYLVSKRDIDVEMPSRDD